MYYVCTGCQSFYEQPLGRMVENVSEKGNVNLHFKAHTGPTVSERCLECNSVLHVRTHIFTWRPCAVHQHKYL